MHRHLVVFVAATLVLGLAACTSGGETAELPPPGKGNSPTLEFTSVQLEGVTDVAAAVKVNGVADQDGSVNKQWRVALDLGSNGLPADPGANGSTASGLLQADAYQGASVASSEGVELTFEP
jgi:hypothetical protein